MAPAIATILAQAAGETRTLIVGSTSTTYGHAAFAQALATPGVVVIFLEDALDPESYGLTTGNCLMLQLRADNPAGAVHTGNELCRIAKYQDHNVAAIYGGTPAPDIRVDLAIQAFAERCPDTSFKVSIDLVAFSFLTNNNTEQQH